jgi:hypothetical protein
VLVVCDQGTVTWAHLIDGINRHQNKTLAWLHHGRKPNVGDAKSNFKHNSCGAARRKPGGVMEHQIAQILTPACCKASRN